MACESMMQNSHRDPRQVMISRVAHPDEGATVILRPSPARLPTTTESI